MNCPECGQQRYDLLPRWGVVTKKDAERPECKVPAGQHCQTCLKARYDFLPA